MQPIEPSTRANEEPRRPGEGKATAGQSPRTGETRGPGNEAGPGGEKANRDVEAPTVTLWGRCGYVPASLAHEP
jgi:hypothetical protein